MPSPVLFASKFGFLFGGNPRGLGGIPCKPRVQIATNKRKAGGYIGRGGSLWYLRKLEVFGGNNRQEISTTMISKEALEELLPKLEQDRIEKTTAFARSFDVLPCKGSTIQDISIELFKLRYLPSAIAADILAENGRDLKEQLASLKFYDLKEDCPTYAGILMFGTNPRFFVPGAYVQYVRFTGEDESSDFEYEHRFDGDLTTQLGQMETFLKAIVVKTVLPELGENYVSSYPLRAIKELLFNAIIHKDYQSNAPIKFYEFSDRIEISNAGGLYGKARPDNFPNENDYRNPALAEAVKNLGYVNGFNVGVKAALAALKNNGSPAPEFITDQPVSFLVKIFKRQ